MRDTVSLFINGQLHAVSAADAFLSLAEYLREHCSLTGTKVVCAEGDCGSCTVLCGRADGDTYRYLPVDSCIQFIFQLDGAHIVTIEGLAANGQLTPVQQAMVDCHGSQCGYCTPGFVMAMTALIETAEDDSIDWRTGLTGNLCRCTGYTPILAAGCQAEQANSQAMNQLYPPQEMLAASRTLREESFEVVDNSTDPPRHAISPLRLADVVAERSRFPGAVLVAGATDVGVQLNKRRIAPRAFIDLNRIAGFDSVQVVDNNRPATGEVARSKKMLVASAGATWTQLAEAFRREVPQFHDIIEIFGSPQIRHVGTIGGNLANASPIADSIPFLMVMGAQLELVGPKGSRLVDINAFYEGYKQLAMRPDELISEVRIPLPDPSEFVRLFKVSRRRDLDISTLTAAFRLQLVEGKLIQPTIAIGGAGPIVLRLPQTELFLNDKPSTPATWQAAADIAITEITPITDVRGSANYRYQLTRNLFAKCSSNLQPEFGA